jgi:hypothetical protein
MGELESQRYIVWRHNGEQDSVLYAAHHTVRESEPLLVLRRRAKFLVQPNITIHTENETTISYDASKEKFSCVFVNIIFKRNFVINKHLEITVLAM